MHDVTLLMFFVPLLKHIMMLEIRVIPVLEMYILLEIIREINLVLKY